MEVYNFNAAETALEEKFIYSEQVNDILNLAFKTSKNVVLFGRGGHGKSEMALEFCRALGFEPYVKTLGKGTLIEDLFGGLDMKKFNEDGTMYYNVENSFMNHEYVILEEAFDAPSGILESLKDPLSAGIFRNGSQVFNLKTKVIIVCTNRPKSEIMQDTSTAALMERFPLELKVEWKSYGVDNYTALFEKVLKKPLKSFAAMIVAANKSSFISPRMALVSADVFDKYGLDYLKFVTGFSESLVKELQVIRHDLEQEEIAATKIKEVLQLAALAVAKAHTCGYQSFSRTMLFDLTADLEKIKPLVMSVSTPDSYVKARDGALNEVDKMISKVKSFADDLKPGATSISPIIAQILKTL